MSKRELGMYRHWLVNEFPCCQICGRNDIDVPHHVGIGIKRSDDRQIVLCLGCHRKVHNVRFSWDVVLDLDSMLEIAKKNFEIYSKEK